jgi:c-di-GMP-binding flagellar brake protein YcgR
MSEEKREFVRLNVLADVVYSRHTSEDLKLTLTKNISAGGICLIVYESFKEGDLLDLKIGLPQDENPINAVGRVVWSIEFFILNDTKSKRYDIGVEFVNLDPKERERINKYVFSYNLNR